MKGMEGKKCIRCYEFDMIELNETVCKECRDLERKKNIDLLKF
jgi:hypothetical protein